MSGSFIISVGLNVAVAVTIVIYEILLLSVGVDFFYFCDVFWKKMRVHPDSAVLPRLMVIN